ncbi:MAG: hypothetical protein PF541_18400 [Prolixibacteraceae bacterium]|nr:hypothetical protein [Prolixibacteraceae bacterium]
MLKHRLINSIFFLILLLFLNSCSSTLDWPESPLYDFNSSDTVKMVDLDLETAMNEIVGHYAHYDVVAYEDSTTQTPMWTFIISYGFTDYYIEDGKLMQSDSFVRATQKINQKNITSVFKDESVQAIKPRVQEVEVFFKEGNWHVYRAATPCLLGITGDPMLPLSTDPNDPNLIDPDQDGNPGVTVEINIANVIKGEIYITRREIYSNHLTLNPNGTLSGYIKDSSEQFVIGASKKILNQASNSVQHSDKGLNPILLVPISANIDTPEELMEIRDKIFPKEPEFVEN